MKDMKKKLLSTTLLMLLLASLSACASSNARGLGTGEEDGEATANEVVKTVAVETMVLEASDHYEEVYLAGQLAAEEAYKVLPYTSGVVSEILVAVGDEVKVGDVLYLLDEEDLMTSKEDTLVSLQRSKDQSYNSLMLAQHDLASGEMNLASAQKNYEDNLTLFESGLITQLAMNGYEDALASSKIAYDRLVISLANAESYYESSVDSYQDSQRNFAENLEDMTVTSPIDGRVTSIDVQVGVTNNMNAGVTVTGGGDILVTGSVIEKYINQVAVGQTAQVEVKAVDKTLQGVVTTVATTSSNSYYPIEVTLDNKDGDLKAGMFAGVTISTDLIEDIITVPKTAILGTGSTKYVYLDKDGFASKTIVSQGRDFGQVVEITEGLTLGDRLVIEGHYYLEEGSGLMVANVSD